MSPQSMEYVNRTVGNGERHARAFHHSQLTTAHLFVGMLNTEGPVKKALEQSDNQIDLRKAVKALEVVAQGFALKGTVSGHIPRSTSVNVAIDGSIRRAQLMLHVNGPVNEDLLFGMLEEGEEILNELLFELGTNADELRELFKMS